MAGKAIILSLPEQILGRLEAEKQRYAYSSIQEIIVDALREKFYFHEGQAGAENDAKPGRPKKINEEKILMRKRIFSREGRPVLI